MRAFGFIGVFLIIASVLLVIGFGILAFLGVRAAVQEERRRKIAKQQSAASQPRPDGGSPLFSAKRRESN